MGSKTARLTLLIDPAKKAAFERLCAVPGPDAVAGRPPDDPRLPRAARRVPFRAGGPRPRRGRRPRAARARADARSDDATGRLDRARRRGWSSSRRGSRSASRAWLALRRVPLRRPALFPAGGAFGLLLGALALTALTAEPQVADAAAGPAVLPFHLRLDSLAAFFLMIIGFVAAGVSRPLPRATSAGRSTPPGPVPRYHVFLAAWCSSCSPTTPTPSW